ncbi:sugar transferase [Sphingosinicella sp. CPCC 101087]|uniref:sugar transferase n=1 Tax=Sphingosinicella sp. CPCC 101087 TaxID=2497754 RepID=UPI00101D9BE6|nr:sugar transferase [Sphingosinicella sp. CPCC 101087]
MWRYLKRPFDVTVAAAALLLLSPVIAAVAVLLWLNTGRPVFFIQVRPGLNGRPFRLVKFRTMRPQPSASDDRLSDSERLTSFGKLLRSTSLDELPELWNVLRGEMSLVGPRPLLLHYLEHYTPDQMRRHDVRPGLTGWAQVNGRNAIAWEAKFALDLWYVDHLSFLLDMKILLLTALQVGMRRGISAEGSATMPEFAPRRRGGDAAEMSE